MFMFAFLYLSAKIAAGWLLFLLLILKTPVLYLLNSDSDIATIFLSNPPFFSFLLGVGLYVV
jgi:hypothetical protein